MHSINARARRVAWDQDPYDSWALPTALNPFRRRRPYVERTVDEERHEVTDESVEDVFRSDDPRGREHMTWGSVPKSSTFSEAKSDGLNQSGPPAPGTLLVHDSEQPENVELSVSVVHARKSRRSGAAASLRLPLDLVAAAIGWKQASLFPLRAQLRKIFFNSWAHVSLLLIPTGFVLHYTKRNPVAVFFVNFAAIGPSIMVLSFVVDTILIYVGELLGGLIATTFSNVAQLITSVLLSRSHQLGVLRTSLVGAILSNLLLMPGLGFFAGGYNRVEQYYNVTIAQTHSTLLLLAILSLIIPTAARMLTHTTSDGIVKQSRGTAIILIVCYGLYMFFQLKTHYELYNEASGKGQMKRGRKTTPVVLPEPEVEDDEAKTRPELPLLTALITLAVFTALLSFNTLFATDSIQALLLRLDISETFLGIVVLPLMSNDPTTVLVAIKDHQDLMLGLTIGRCVQIALLLIPFIVLLAWMMGINDMSLSFEAFETLVMLASVLVVNYIVADGKSHWLVGALLIASYIIVSVSAYYIP